MKIIQHSKEINFFRIEVENKRIQNWLGKGVVGIGIKKGLKEKDIYYDIVIFPTKNAKKAMTYFIINPNDLEEMKFLKKDMEEGLEDLMKESKKTKKRKK